VIVVPHQAPPARRWLAHLMRASEILHAPRDAMDAQTPFDPDAVLALARQEGVAPLLHLGCVNGRIGDVLPERFRSACEADYYRTLRANMIALKTGRRILESLESQGIAAAPLAGWSLLQGPVRFHADPGSRPLEQLELMVRESERERAEFVLAELGYRRITRRISTVRGGHELAFQRNDAGADLFVELHWGWEGAVTVGQGAGATGDEFLDGLCDTTVSGTYRPTRFAQLLLASLRVSRHSLGRWIWLDDIHRIITAIPMDWGEVVEQARRWRARAPIYASLEATRELLQTPVPRDAIRELAPGPLRRRLLQRSLAACQGRDRASRAARAAQLLLAENWWDVARAAARRAGAGSGRRAEHGGVGRVTQVRLSHPQRVVSPSAAER